MPGASPELRDGSASPRGEHARQTVSPRIDEAQGGRERDGAQDTHIPYTSAQHLVVGHGVALGELRQHELLLSQAQPVAGARAYDNHDEHREERAQWTSLMA